uniref:UBX domain-containing protein 11 n=1 Tax=Calidris pygmaea TaxID=425635 RepID=A0A8C3KPB7_9CHAR
GERHEQLEDLESLKDEEELPARSLWKPGKTPIDFDLILENVKDLNVLAGEGISQIEHTPGGARLRQPKPLPLTLYQNGIVMFNGPFRPYEDPSTQQCLQDIMDGYFPSELQMRYPDGIPLQVSSTNPRSSAFWKKLALVGCGAAKRSWWRHPGCLPWRGTDPFIPAPSGSHLPPISSLRAYFRGLIEAVNGLTILIP